MPSQSVTYTTRVRPSPRRLHPLMLLLMLLPRVLRAAVCSRRRRISREADTFRHRIILPRVPHQEGGRPGRPQHCGASEVEAAAGPAGRQPASQPATST